LPPPLFRALAFLAVLVALAIGLAGFANLDAVWQRISAAPDLWLAVIGSTLTAVLAALAAYPLYPGLTATIGGGWRSLPQPHAPEFLPSLHLGRLLLRLPLR
jgi:hypothetical protein